jgi:hypothetical protein
MIILGLSSLPWVHTLMGLEEINNDLFVDKAECRQKVMTVEFYEPKALHEVLLSLLLVSHPTLLKKILKINL